MKKILSAILLSFLTLSVVYGQNDIDAIRYSQPFFGGTARGMGLAGATGALGADFSSASDNPAGIGMYRKNEFTFTPAINFSSSSSSFLGTQTDAQKANANINIGNLGFVWTRNFDEKRVRGWKSISFAIGANRLADFNSSTYYTGYNNSNSLVNNYLEELNANGGEPSANIATDVPFDANLAYSTNLITQSNGIYTSPVAGGGVQQSNLITTSGNITEYLVSIAGNYNNKLYMGLTIGIPSIHYNYASNYTETNVNNNIAGFNNFTLTNNVNTTGTGVNAKFGLIYRVNDYLRLGAAVHSPTYYSLHDSYSSSMTTDLTSGVTTAYSPYGSFDYSLYTPWKFVGSAAIIFNKYGFISADYEYIDYSQAYYSFYNGGSSDIDYQNAQNNLISTKYGPTSNFKVGAEIALDIFRIRGGYAMYGSPFNSGYGVSGFDNSANYITGGVGFREHNFFLDLGLVHSLNHTFQQPYTLAAGEQAPGANITSFTNDFLVTIGIRY
jgi:hypothetical protein